MKLFLSTEEMFEALALMRTWFKREVNYDSKFSQFGQQRGGKSAASLSMSEFMKDMLKQKSWSNKNRTDGKFRTITSGSTKAITSEEHRKMMKRYRTRMRK